MERKDKEPSGNVPTGLPEEPLSGHGRDHQSWSPTEDAQGISTRVMDEDPDAEKATDPSKD